MMAVNRSAAGRWCGVSQGGGSPGTSGRSSRARAARAATAAGAADASAPSRRASGSAGVSRCSERIRGGGGGTVERTAVGGIEVEELGDEGFVGRAPGAIRREPRPTGGCGRRHGQLPHDAGGEAPEAGASGAGGAAGGGGVPARVEAAGDSGGVARPERGSPV